MLVLAGIRQSASGGRECRGRRPGVFMIRGALLTIVALCTASCGYRFSDGGGSLPKTIHTVAIPAFTNLTTRYKLTDQLPEIISREFITRTRYRVVSDADSADAVLRGTVITYSFYPTIFD